MVDPSSPAAQMVGKKLSSGWLIVEKLGTAAHPTGSNFGVAYRAEKDGEQAFVKAVDLTGAAKAADPIAELQKLLSWVSFERDVLEFCTSKRLSKVIHLLGAEYFPDATVAGAGVAAYERVYCLVCELGQGDLRKKLDTVKSPPYAWLLQVMSDVALALDQLHRHSIGHQDVKPSNVITLDSGLDSGNKLGDLGRVVRKGVSGPFDATVWPGDWRYAPPEVIYGYTPPEWADRRESADAFMLGGLLFFLFTNASLLQSMAVRIPPNLLPPTWRGTYDATVVAAWRDARTRALLEDFKPTVPSALQDDLMELAMQLTEPNPVERGDKNARKQTSRPVGIDRFHQRFRQLALRARIEGKKSAAP